MFRKLLKYDLYAVFKYWWIAALSSVGFAALAGICIRIVDVEYTQYYAIYGLGILGLVLSVIGMGLFPVLTTVLVLVRLYKHFFSDEGYLTFTLPVKKSQLLNSKILMSFLFNCVTLLLLAIEAVMMVAIGIPDEFFDPLVWQDILQAVKCIFEWLGAAYSVVFLLELLLGLVAASLFATLMQYVCLTVAAVTVHKHKVLAAIGIYYGANWLLSTIMQFILFSSNFFTVYDKIELMIPDQQKLCISLMLLVVIAFGTVLCTGLYILENGLLDKKLNLE